MINWVTLGSICPWYELSWVRVVLDTSWSMHESSWVRIILGMRWPWHEMTWVRIAMGTKCPDLQIVHNSYPRQLIHRTSRTKGNSYPRQHVPNIVRNQDSSYPWQLAHRANFTQNNPNAVRICLVVRCETSKYNYHMCFLVLTKTHIYLVHLGQFRNHTEVS